MPMMLALLILESSLWLVGGQEITDKAYIGPKVNGSNTDVVVLGGLFPVHDVDKNRCGKFFDSDMQWLEGMVLATQKINDDNSILPGVTLAFEIRDTCAHANIALEESLKFVSGRSLKAANGRVWGISGVVGAAFSRASTSVARLLRLFQVPQISYASTANVLSDKTIYDYFFRTIPPDSLQARAMVDIIEYFNWTYVIAMHTSDIYGREGIEAFIDEFEKKNSTQRCVAMSSIEIPDIAGTDDFERAIEIINQEWVNNATVIVLFAQRDTAIGLFEAVRKKRMENSDFASKNFTWIGSDGWGDRLPEDLREVAQGSLSVFPRSLTSVEFDNYFQSLHPSNYSANPWFEEYWESIFNCSLRGEQKCDCLNQFISNETGYRQSGFVTFSIDAVYAFAHAIHNMQRDFCPGGRGLCYGILDSRSGGLAIRGALLREYLHNVSFSPAASTDVISFDSNGDQQGGYVVTNLKQVSDGKFDSVIVGHWDELPLDRTEKIEIFGEIEWSHGQNTIPESLCSYPCGGGKYPEPIANQAECCWVCRPCSGTHDVGKGLECIQCGQGYKPNESRTECVLIPPSYLMWSDWLSIVILILTLFGIIATTAVAVVFTVYHKHQLIKASSRELSVVLLTGIMLCYLLPFFFIAKPAVWICGVRRFGIGFCFSICYSALLVKTNRIHRIFNRPSSSSQVPPLISPESQLFFTALLVAVQVVMVAIWLAAEEPKAELFYDDDVTELRCGESLHIGLSVSLGYNFLLLMATLYFAFRTRKVPQNFNEARFINLTMYTLSVLWLAFIPTYYATANLDTNYQTGSLVLAIILNATVTLCILFVPKIYFIFTREQTDHFIPPSTFTTPKHISSSDQKSFKFLSINLPATDSDMCNPDHPSLPTPQHNALELTKGSNNNEGRYGTGTGSVDVEEEPYANMLSQQHVDASTQTDV